MNRRDPVLLPEPSDLREHIGNALLKSHCPIALGAWTELEDLLDRKLRRRFAPEHAPRVAAEIDKLRSAFASTAELLNASLKAQRFDLPPAEVFARASVPVEASVGTMAVLLDTADLGINAHSERLMVDLTLTGVLLAAGLLLWVYLALGLYASLKDAIGHTIDGGRRLAEGDLTARIRVASQDEFGDIANSFNSMADSLSGLIARVKSSAGEVSQVTMALASATQQISEASAGQSQSASAMAATIEEQPLQGEPVRDGNELATIMYPSGTTGMPKGVMHSFATYAWSFAAVQKRLGSDHRSRILSFLPLSHVAERTVVEHSLLAGRHRPLLFRLHAARETNARTAV